MIAFNFVSLGILVIRLVCLEQSGKFFRLSSTATFQDRTHLKEIFNVSLFGVSY